MPGDLPPLLHHMGVTEPKKARPKPPEGWARMAYDAFSAFATPGMVFKGEDVRKAAEAAGVPAPPDPRAWGGIIRRAFNEGRLVRIGNGRTANRQAHGRQVIVWQAK